jgi:hypothetical protein
MARAVAALAALLVPVSGVRNTRSAAKAIAGVPILNYELRHLQLEAGPLASADTRFDWVLAFGKQATDKELTDFCSNAGKASCTFVGHPDEHGAAMVVLRSTEDELNWMVESHAARIEFVEPDVPVSLPEVMQSVEPAATPWNLAKVGASPRGRFSGRGTSIYVFDSGVRSTHEQFGGRVTPTIDTLAGRGNILECRGDVSCSNDDNGHGTHCAGTAGGKDYGAAPEARLYAMRVCCGSGTNIMAGMDWLATRVRGPTIMTMSLGLTQPAKLMAEARVLDTVVAAGVTVFVAAGNSNADTCEWTYGFIESAIAVGATDSNNRRAGFSCWGRCNDIYAPGVSIPSAWKGSDTDTRSIDGTSMATPLVAGVGALILEEYPSFTPQQVRSKLLERATKGALTNLRSGDPNVLLYATAGGPAPSPVPPPSPTPAVCSESACTAWYACFVSRCRVCPRCS